MSLKSQYEDTYLLSSKKEVMLDGMGDWSANESKWGDLGLPNVQDDAMQNIE